MGTVAYRKVDVDGRNLGLTRAWCPRAQMQADAATGW